MNDPLNAALGYASAGWPVFPCRTGQKIPATIHGVLDATTDPEQIRAWWNMWPDANVAIATGDPGPDVIDVDVKPDGTGWAAFTELKAAGLIDGASRYVQTPSGGLHAYYKGTPQRNGTIRGKHIDFRGKGGYVVAPPSAVEGKPYQPLEVSDPGAAATDWRAIRALLEPPPEFTQPAHPTSNGQERPGDLWAAQATWDDILLKHGWVKVRDLGNGHACWCRPGKDGPFTSATTREDGGLYVFSTSTPFDPEKPYTKFGALAVLEHGGDYAAAAQALRDEGYGTPLPGVTDPGEDELEAIAAAYIPVNWAQAWDEQPDETEWLIPGFLEAGTVNSLFAKAGIGKSLLALDISRALAQQGITVVYIDDENRIGDLVERLQDMGCTPAELDHLLVYSFAGLPALDTATGGRHLKAIAVTRHARLVILDTTSRMIAGKENDADTFLQLYRCSLLGLKKNGITVLRLDHPGKDMTKGQRGSSAKEGDVDTIWRLEPVTGITYRLEREKSRSGHGEAAFTLQRQAHPLRHEWEVFGADNELIRQLDELGLPRDAGRDKARALLSQAGISAGTDALTEALRARKLRFRPGLTDSGQVQVRSDRAEHDTAEPVRDITEPIHEYPRSDLTWTGNGQAGQVDGGATQPDLTQPPPRRGAVAVRSGAPDLAPLCDRCGEHHHRYGDQGRPCVIPAVTQ